MSRWQRVLVLGAMAIVGVAAARIETPSAVANVRYPYVSCGVERWSVKTLQDRPRLLPLRRTTIAWLVSRPAPDGVPAARLPLERRIFQVVGAVTLVRPEDDSDLHLVLVAGGRRMIVEAPGTACTAGATPLTPPADGAARGSACGSAPGRG